ncbi:hypothetical protein E2C01_042302 [Portunus trituberculatus]|uniref:Uncharacterized protein n=1 Tax=Portunus trituberculatus TaxID=210409 RepID=A0A5B7FUF1_PORTR|nr:hypothetical protein [Portunus trituberculatus]
MYENFGTCEEDKRKRCGVVAWSHRDMITCGTSACLQPASESSPGGSTGDGGGEKGINLPLQRECHSEEKQEGMGAEDRLTPLHYYSTSSPSPGEGEGEPGGRQWIVRLGCKTSQDRLWAWPSSHVGLPVSQASHHLGPKLRRVILSGGKLNFEPVRCLHLNSADLPRLRVNVACLTNLHDLHHNKTDLPRLGVGVACPNTLHLQRDSRRLFSLWKLSSNKNVQASTVLLANSTIQPRFTC